MVWRCACDCGGEKIAKSINLLSGRTKSCGCRRVASHIRHGHYGTRTYIRWGGMIQRCYQPSASSYAYYGGRGIAVCDRWRESFAAFMEDLGECPEGHELDRIDTNKGYEPGNCAWATRMEQMKNIRRNKWIEAFGERRHLCDWARIYDIDPATLWNRLYRGWAPERALTEPLHK